jgi:hypothetical protein
VAVAIPALPGDDDFGAVAGAADAADGHAPFHGDTKFVNGNATVRRTMLRNNITNQ